MFKKISLAAAGLAVAATTLFAASHADAPFAGAIKARQAHMKLYAHNIGILGSMAKGAVEYDSTAAAAAAANLASLSMLSQAGYWPEGSESESNEGTDALAALWQNFGDVSEKGGDLAKAAQAMAMVAGDDLGALQGAMKELGGACGACHKKYRKPQK